MTPAALKPRAIAVLVALRDGGRTRAQLRNAIADQSTSATLNLLGDMRRKGLVGQVPDDDRWYLDHDGDSWLETRSLRVSRSARLWSAVESRSVRK